MMESPSLESVRGYNGYDNATGAQTERRGDLGPVRALLGGEDLTGRFFPSLYEPSYFLSDFFSAVEPGWVSLLPGFPGGA
jgi:hypothetical protein